MKCITYGLLILLCLSCGAAQQIEQVQNTVHSQFGFELLSSYEVKNDLSGIHIQIGDDLTTRVGPFNSISEAEEFADEFYAERYSQDVSPTSPEKVLIFGHRGMGGTTLITGSDSNQYGSLPKGYIQENTLRSFEESLLNQKADGIEFDIFTTKDGIPVVIHGDEIDKYVVGADPRKNKYGKISELTLQEVKKINIAGVGNPKQTIPTLEELYEKVSTLDKLRIKAGMQAAKTKVELKFPSNANLNQRLIQVDKVMENLKSQVESGKTKWSKITVQSFDQDALLHIRTNWIDAGQIPDNTRLLVSFKTTDLYNKNHLDGFIPKPGAPFDPVKIREMDSLINKLKPAAIEPAFGDINQPLIDLVKKHKVTLELSFANYRYIPEEMIISARQIAKQVPVSVQGDEPEELRKSFNSVQIDDSTRLYYSRGAKAEPHHAHVKRFI